MAIASEWSIKRGRLVSASTYRQERRVLIAILNAAIRDGIILDNPATHLPTRKLAKAKIIPLANNSANWSAPCA